MGKKVTVVKNGRPDGDESKILARRICKNINKRMEERDLLCADIAKLTGFTPGIVGRWVNGMATPGLVAMTRLARALKVDASYFFQPQTRR